MVEHVGESQIDLYAQKLRDLLPTDGRLLNHGIARLDPNAPKPSKEAIKAGADAARLQSFYLQSQHQPKP